MIKTYLLYLSVTLSLTCASFNAVGEIVFRDRNYAEKLDKSRQSEDATLNEKEANSINNQAWMFSIVEDTRERDARKIEDNAQEINRAAHNDLEARAQEGDIDAINQLGYIHFKKGTPKDMAIAIKWFTVAADEGDKLAQLALGYIIGITDRSRLNEANALIGQGHAANEGRAFYLRYLIANQQGLYFNQIDSLDLLSKSAELEDELGLNEMGINAEKSGLTSVALAYFQRASQRGSAAAKENEKRLEVLFDKEGTPLKDDQSVKKEAFQLLVAQAKMGDGKAAYQLATYYHKGVGVIANYTLALEYYQHAAEKNNMLAKKMLQLIFSGPKDDKGQVSSSWIAKLAETIHPDDTPALAATTKIINSKEQRDKDPLASLFNTD